LQDILALAARNFLPIISDEIYAGMNWTGHPFTPLYRLPSEVPIVTIGGLAKRWLVPGWRVGWVVLHERGCEQREHGEQLEGRQQDGEQQDGEQQDGEQQDAKGEKEVKRSRNSGLTNGPVTPASGLFTELRRGISNLSQTQLHPNTVFQTALPEILKTPPEFFDGVVQVLKGNARLVCDILGKAIGLRVIEPQGAMYAMVGNPYPLRVPILNFLTFFLAVFSAFLDMISLSLFGFLCSSSDTLIPIPCSYSTSI
jgi:tyrosine aminotransferase